MGKEWPDRVVQVLATRKQARTIHMDRKQRRDIYKKETEQDSSLKDDMIVNLDDSKNSIRD